MDFLYVGNESGGCRCPERCFRFGAREDVSSIAIVNLKGASTGGRVYAVVVSESRKG